MFESICLFCVFKAILLFIICPLILYLFQQNLYIYSFDGIRQIFFDIISRKKPFFSALFRVDENSQQYGGQLVASVLKSHGVQEIFTLCGGHISPILVSCKKLGIKVIDTRHEVTTVFAADAVARLRQSIGVAAVTSGPGITNTITALKNAQMAESAVLLLGGGSPTLLKGSGALQDIDQMVLVSPICKYSARIKRIRDIVPTIRKAIHIAQSGTPGPVFVELPIDTLYTYQNILKEAGLSKNPTTFRYLIDTFVFAYVSWQFSDAFAEQDLTPIPIEVPKPIPQEIETVVKLIASAKKPLILLGSQALVKPVSPSVIAELIKNLGIPTYLSGMSRGLLGTDCELQMRHYRRDALLEADLIILAGTVCDFRLNYGKILPSTAKVIAINRNKEQLKKNHKVFWNGEILIQADVGFTLFEVYKSLQKVDYKSSLSEWIKNLRDRDENKERNIEKKSFEKANNNRYNPLSFLRALDKTLPEDTIYIADGGDFVGSAAYIAKPRGPLKWLDPGAFGTLGVGGGFALGAKIAFPESTVVILYGDGSAGYSIIEFDTFVRFKLPVIAVIGNDACWTQIARDQIPRFNSNVACDLAYTNYEQVGIGLGTRGEIFENDNDDNLKGFCDSVNKAVEASKKRHESTILNVLMGTTDFRSGSLSI